jgi:signal transduction histidine kinase/ActR/RegA family two-component response regulator
MDLHKVVPFFVLMLNLLLLGSALAASDKSEQNRSFAWLSLAISIWNLGVVGLRLSRHETGALAWERFLHLGVIAIPILFYQYVLVMIGERPRRPSLATGYVVGGAFIGLIATPLFIAGVTPTVWGFAPKAGPLYAPFLLYFMAYMALGLHRLLRAYRAATSTFRKNRMRLVLLGVFVSLGGGVFDFVRFLFGLERLYPSGIPATAIFALALGVAIVRYRLVNVRGLAKRVLLYALTWAAMTPAVLFAVDVIADVLPRTGDIGERAGQVDAVVLLSALMLSLPVMRKLDALLNRLMFHRRRAMAEALVALNRELSRILDVNKLATMLTEELAARVPVAHVRLYAPAGDRGELMLLARATGGDAGELPGRELSADVALWVRATRKTLVVDEIGYASTGDGPGSRLMIDLERDHVALVVPAFLDAELTAILVVGEKLSNEVFDPDEIELLEVLVGRAATALKNARLYQDLEAQMAALRAERGRHGAARESDGSREQRLGVLAHELRDPLGPILNATHVLQSIVVADPTAESMIAMIQRQTRHLARLVDDVLDASRSRPGRIRLNAELVDLGRLVEQCVGTLETSGKGYGRAIQRRLPGEVLLVRGDRVRLEHVVWNLLDNALKYSAPDAPIQVTVDRDGEHGIVRIEDEGIGIAADMLATMFEPSGRTAAAARKVPGGLGVRLALVRRLVEEHGGTVTAQSAGPGRGSAFTVRLPLVADAATPQPEPIVAAATPGRRVLIVEDTPDARESLRVLVELLGHHVRCAGDAATAMEIARAWMPEAVLVDIGLPDVDGYELARRLRKTADGEQMYLAAVTSYDQPEDRRRALASGFDAHFAKPLSRGDLKRMVAARRLVDAHSTTTTEEMRWSA